MSATASSSELSVIVKCYNEEAHLGRCLRALLAATAGIKTEIIVVDSMSTDRSALVADAYPVRIVQLADHADRRCGAVAQLGFQFARGTFLLLIDGDMELLPGFLPAAMALFDQDLKLAGVGGRLIELSDGIEFRERQLRGEGGTRPGAAEQITGCGLYRAAAIRDLGFFMDRNMHCFEEFEFSLRLRARGWRLQILGVESVRHYGHREPPFQLLLRRWRTHFLYGYGELLRSAWCRPYFIQAVQRCSTALVVIPWWIALVLLAPAAPIARWPALAFIVTAILPFLALLGRKRSVVRTAYSLLVWQFAAICMIGGLFARRIEPTVPVAARVLKDCELRSLDAS